MKFKHNGIFKSKSESSNLLHWISLLFPTGLSRVQNLYMGLEYIEYRTSSEIKLAIGIQNMGTNPKSYIKWIQVQHINSSGEKRF